MTPSLGGAEPIPPAAAEVFGARLSAAIRYAEFLAGPGVARGMLGPREGGQIWTRHILNCAALLPFLGDARSVIDLGSGAGLPGIVLALARPDLRVTLLEPMARRVAYLGEAVHEVGAANAEVVRGRAEEYAGRRQADVVVARAVAPLSRLIGWAAPLVAPHGQVLALKGTDADQEVAAARAELRRHDARVEICPVTAPGAAVTTTVVRVVVNPL